MPTRSVWLGIGALVCLAAAIWLWGGGGANRLAAWAANEQHQVQNALAQALRALKTNQPGALLSLLSLCFAYGFFHAAGPGHGKLVIGGYGLGQKVAMKRLIGLAIGSSLAQAGTAILLVVGGLSLLDWGRVELTGLTEEVLAPLSYGLIALLGLWLALRGGRKLWPHIRHQALHGTLQGHGHNPSKDGTQHNSLGRRLRHSLNPHGVDDHTHAHSHIHPTHHHDADLHDASVCPDCGHRHGPTLDEVANTKTLRDALAIMASVAARPCTGAVFLLLLTWRLDLMTAGVLGTLAMGLGTASITIAVAVASVTFRTGTLSRLSGPRARTSAATMELVGGLIILLVASQIVLRLI
ncbi:hypothetical protein KMP13_03545 [Epibacterium ulvae]|uniref:nickel/cobalt transporter n=1 Tax=Epibacterium ulvae TaxID=1156985 RepID=UPI001BFC0515|nr:hypothetical protein [Epibacterium ulvae]MBT8152976.1 hypothetical protein [Epibacterium ulvae]